MRAITNLLNNAARYGRDGGHIWLTLSKATSGIEISVRDDGIGISEDDQAKIWKRFYQVNKSNNTVSGSGLGLSIVQGIIQAHKGTISLRSSLGVGSEFIIRIPEKQG